MSLRIDLREFRSAYVTEADELLTAANARLIELEAALRDGRSGAREVRELLRALHTIKGLSAMVDVEPIVTLAHRMESLLRRSDRAGGNLDDPGLQALVEGTRAIERLVRAVAEGRPLILPSPALLRALDVDVPEGGPSVEGAVLLLEEELVAKLAPDERERLVREAVGDRRAVRVDFVPSPAKADAGLTISSVRQRAGAIADIVRVLPLSVPASEEAPGGLRFAILALTQADDAAIASAVGGQPGDVRVLVETTGEPPSLAGIEAAPVEESRRSGVLRVDVARVDDAVEKLSGLIVTRSRLANAVAALTAAGAPTRDLVAIMNDQGRQLRELRSAMLRVRMVPVAEVLERLPLVVRDLRRTSGKSVRLEVSTGGAELDKTVAERLFPALVHLLRNAVDHGVESPEERERIGKPAEAVIRIACVARTNRLLEVSVSDDGHGVDREGLARRAGRSDLLDDDTALLEAMCRPGLTTRDLATTISGRGMGMDIVRKITVEQLGGELRVETARRRGTTFIVRIPLTIAVVDAFAVRCAGERFVVPVPLVDEIVELEGIAMLEGPRTAYGPLTLIQRRGEAVPLLDLGQVLGMRRAAEPVKQALIVQRAKETIAFGLERVLGQQETVVRPIEDVLVQVPGISGTTDLGDGRATLVLDLLALATKASAREHAA